MFEMNVFQLKFSDLKISFHPEINIHFSGKCDALV